MYFNSLYCPNCNEVNVNVRPNFYVNANKRKNTSFTCQLQSAEEELTGNASVQNSVLDTQGLNQSMDATSGVSVDNVSAHISDTNSHLFQNPAELSSFLSRPVLIKSYTWAEGASLSQSFNPWYEYLNTTLIKNKLQNYYYASMKLHLKFMINASPFYYGMAIAAYQPLNTVDPCTISTVSSSDLYMMALSQRPHIYLYPQTSQGGTLTLPFVWPYDSINITSAADLQGLGLINLNSVTVLDNANAVSGTGATIRVYAYATEVKLGGPTVRAALQSGVISAPASAVANISRSLEKVPIIGKFARATSIGAGAVSSIASLFGFTDTPVIRDVEAFKVLPFHSVTSAHLAEPVTKLCLDPKNEVSVDPSLIGVETEDQLIISNFVNRYAICGTTYWSASDAPDAILWSSRVTPNTRITSALGMVLNSRAVQYAPMGLVGQLFKYWRGGITYKINAVASKFHRGRYVITWDPVGDITANTSYIGTCYTKIVDIAEESEIEVTIPYMQPYPFLQTSDSDPTNNLSQLARSTLTNVDKFTNGVLTIRVFTAQTSPVATSDIRLVISAKGASDLEFAMPSGINPNLSPFAYQSNDDDVTTDTRSSVQLTNENQVLDKTRYLVSFGEPFLSLRSLMRRATMCTTDIIPYPTTPSGTIMNYAAQRSVYPIAPGFDPNGVHFATKAATGTTAPYNWVNYSVVDFITQCFLARRGSIIHHFNINAGKTPMGYLASSFSTNTRVAADWNSSNAWLDTSSLSQLTKASRNVLDEGASGCDMTQGFVMPAMSVQVPHNTPMKFMVTNPKYSVLGAALDYSNMMTLHTTFSTRDAGLTQVIDYIQIGQDYSVSMFLNVPTLYWVTTLPVAPA